MLSFPQSCHCPIPITCSRPMTPHESYRKQTVYGLIEGTKGGSKRPALIRGAKSNYHARGHVDRIAPYVLQREPIQTGIPNQ